MIDESWLRTTVFEFDGARTCELLHLGESIVFRGVKLDDGQGVIMKVLHRHHLGFYIREAPASLTGKPTDDIDRLNQKLSRLVGEPALDLMTMSYDRLYSWLCQELQKAELSTLLDPPAEPEALATKPKLLVKESKVLATNALSFLLATPGVRRRLEEDRELISPFWGQHLLASLERLQTSLERLQNGHPLQPHRLPENPLFVWAAAVIEGFYPAEALQQAVDYLNDTFGSLRTHPHGGTFIGQAQALLHGLLPFLEAEEAGRLFTFLTFAGLGFQMVKSGSGLLVGLSGKESWYTGYLIFRRDDGLGPVFAIQPFTEVTIGRAPENHLVVTGDDMCSGTHAGIISKGIGWRVRDLGSANGTQVNGVAVTGEDELHPGDEITFGRTRAVFLDSLAKLLLLRR